MRKFLKLAHYFPYDVKLRLLAHSRSFLANQKARNAIVAAEHLLCLLTLSCFLLPPVIDECVSGAHDCHSLASCTNTVGSYTCTCNHPYVGDGKTCVNAAPAGEYFTLQIVLQFR